MECSIATLQSKSNHIYTLFLECVCVCVGLKLTLGKLRQGLLLNSELTVNHLLQASPASTSQIWLEVGHHSRLFSLTVLWRQAMTLMVLWQELYPLSHFPLSKSHSSLSFTANNKILVKILIFNFTQNLLSYLRHTMPNVLRLFIIFFHDLKLGFIWWLCVGLRMYCP